MYDWNRSVNSHKISVALLKYGDTFHIEGKAPFNKPRINVYARTGATILVMKLGISSKPMSIDDLRRRTSP
jgi:hypothetical protein